MRFIPGLFVLLAASAALAAPRVFINGVDIEGLKNQTFENCQVQIDAKGDVYVTAKGYKIERKAGEGGPAGASAPRTVKALYIVATQRRPGATQFIVDAYLNGVPVRQLGGAEEQAIVDVTSYVRPGKNKLTLVARKRIEGARVSSSPTDTFQVLLGRGGFQGGKVVLDTVMADFKRSADELKDVTQDFVFEQEP